MRLFVAADLPDGVRAAIAAEQTRLASALREPFRRAARSSLSSLKWVKPEHSHLTLVFLGDIADARVPELAAAIGRDVDQPAFDITLESLGVFPPRGAPRVLWIGIGGGASALGDLQREIARRIASLGIELESRPFHPHLTLARWRDSRPADRERALTAAPGGIVARARVEGATLYQSRLSAAGPAYTALARATLTKSG